MTVKSCEKLEKSQVALTIEIGAEEFEAALQKAYLKNRKSIRVPGFRPGKAPRKMMERYYGEGIFFEEAANIVIPDAYEAAVKEQDLNVVGYPSVEPVGEISAQGFTFKATAPVYPEVKLGEYKGLHAEKAEVSVTDEDVAARIQQVRQRNSRLVTVEREAKEGDTVVIDYQGLLDGKPFDGGTAEHHSLELGSKSFVPGFEEQLIGCKAGDEKDLDITFPEDYHEDLAGKAVVFKVKVHEVQEREYPELDDDFAQDVSEFDTFAEYEADVRNKLMDERLKASNQAFEDALMQKVAEGITADIPEAMIRNQQEQFLQNFKMQMASSGLKYEDYISYTGSSEEQVLEEAREPAERQVRLDLALAQIVKDEKLEVTDEDCEAEFKRFAEQYNMELEQVKKYITADQIKDSVLTKKAVAVVVDSAIADAPAPKAEAEEIKPEDVTVTEVKAD